MADDRMAVLETVSKAIAEGDVDFLREGVRVLAQSVMEAKACELTGVAFRVSCAGCQEPRSTNLTHAATFCCS